MASVPTPYYSMWHYNCLWTPTGCSIWDTAWNTCFSNVFECLKSLSHRRTDVAHCEYVGKSQVAYNSASNNATSVVASTNHRRYKNSHATGPRQRVQLLPEPTDHQRHVETEDECNWDAVASFVAELSDIFEIATPSMQTETVRDKVMLLWLIKLCCLGNSFFLGWWEDGEMSESVLTCFSL